MTAAPNERLLYRWPRSLVLRPFGVVLAALGVLWISVVASSGRFGDGAGTGLRVGLLLVVLAVVVVGAWLLTWPPVVLELTATAYRVRHVRGCPVPAAQWRQVEKVQTQGSRDGSFVVLSLAGGQRSLVPVSLLGARAAEAEAEIRDRLNSAHGYRRLGG